jgi:hypothetical protein
MQRSEPPRQNFQPDPKQIAQLHPHATRGALAAHSTALPDRRSHRDSWQAARNPAAGSENPNGLTRRILRVSGHRLSSATLHRESAAELTRGLQGSSD